MMDTSLANVCMHALPNFSLCQDEDAVLFKGSSDSRMLSQSDFARSVPCRKFFVPPTAIHTLKTVSLGYIIQEPLNQ